MRGRLLGEPVGYSAHGGWILNHQFLKLHLVENSTPPQYEAEIYLGFDASRDRYVVHWLDTLGAKPSATLGYGKREMHVLRFQFDYESGPFRDTLSYDAGAQVWQLSVERMGEDGTWVEFASHTLHRRDKAVLVE